MTSALQVEEGHLAYDRADYDGELYRMNVSCDDVMTTEGCLFFELQSDQTKPGKGNQFRAKITPWTIS